jgi:hypothetical protein
VPREDAASKARRLLSEGRIRIVAADRHEIRALAWGDSGEQYDVVYEPGGWTCSCAAFGPCSHKLGAMLITLHGDGPGRGGSESLGSLRMGKRIGSTRFSDAGIPRQKGGPDAS